MFKPATMKRSQLLLFLSLGLLFWSACTDKNQSTEAAAFQEMMAIHDEVMPKMGDINRLSRQLKKMETVVDSTNRQLLGQIDLAIRALEKADQGMMAWMNFNGGRKLEKLQAEKAHEEIMQYIQEEEKSIRKVQVAMLESITQAEKLVEPIPEKQ
jgi:hypothetical protein